MPFHLFDLTFPKNLQAARFHTMISYYKHHHKTLFFLCVQEKEDKAILQVEVQNLRQDNMRLQEESQTAAAQLRRFTEWFFHTIDKKPWWRLRRPGSSGQTRGRNHWRTASTYASKAQFLLQFQWDVEYKYMLDWGSHLAGVRWCRWFTCGAECTESDPGGGLWM